MPRRGAAAIGEVDRNNQRLTRKTDRPGNHGNQRVWMLQCMRPKCGNVYGANGCDFWLRLCPSCQGGRPGLPVVES